MVLTVRLRMPRSPVQLRTCAVRNPGSGYGLGILVHQTAEDLAAADPSGVQVDDW
jgi:hypothetical protein